MNGMLKKLLVVLAGALFALVLLEISLAVFGAMNARRPASVAPVPADAYRILCLGDSFTFGLGAPAEKSYPAQLEELLNANTEGRKFKVYNYGCPGQNTSQLLERLPRDLAEVRPAMVVLLAGGANTWNFLGYRASQANGAPNDYLYRIRVFKLVKLLTKNLRERSRGPAGAINYRDTGNYDETIDSLREQLRVSPQKASLHRDLGTVYQTMRDYHGAAAAFRQAIANDPRDEKSYLALASVYREINRFEEALAVYAEGVAAGIPRARFESHVSSCRGQVSVGAWKLDEAEQWFKKGIADDPSNFENYRELARVYASRKKNDEAISYFLKSIALAPRDSLSYCLLGNLYEVMGRQDDALKAFQQGIAASPNEDYNPCYFRFMRAAGRLPADRLAAVLPHWKDINTRLFQDSRLVMDGAQSEREIDARIARWIGDDLSAIVRACRKSGILVLMQNYPDDSRMADRVLGDVARKHALPFVDNVAVFGDLLGRGAAFQDYYIPDGHCNARGYGVMAQNCRDAVLKLLRE